MKPYFTYYVKFDNCPDQKLKSLIFNANNLVAALKVIKAYKIKWNITQCSVNIKQVVELMRAS